MKLIINVTKASATNDNEITTDLFKLKKNSTYAKKPSWYDELCKKILLKVLCIQLCIIKYYTSIVEM